MIYEGLESFVYGDRINLKIKSFVYGDRINCYSL